MRLTARFAISRHHPALAGHFPGRPIVPGVVLLDHAAAAILSRSPGGRIAGFATVTFAAPVLAEDEVEMAWTGSAGGEISFVLSVAGKTVLNGRARLGDAAR